jgi:hypothetical protein
MRSRDLGRAAGLLSAVLVALLTTAVVTHATQVITVPNAASVSYSLAAGANSAAITPAANTPVFVMGCQLALGFRGVSQVTLLHIPGNFLEWVGLESTAGAAITQGFSATAGTHILFLDFSHQVDIRVSSADTFVVHNGSSGARNGVLKLIW